MAVDLSEYLPMKLTAGEERYCNRYAEGDVIVDEPCNPGRDRYRWRHGPGLQVSTRIVNSLKSKGMLRKDERGNLVKCWTDQ